MFHKLMNSWFIATFSALISLSVPAVGADSEEEADLIAVLASEDAPKADKALACKKLAIKGSAAAVPELVKLLGDGQLASWSRIALEAIPDAAADEALRSALPDLEGKLLVGAINSIGVRRDSAAIESLAEKLTDTDANVAAAAAVALGRIGNLEAAKVLRERLAKSSADVRSYVAEGCIYCAEQALADGRAEDAIAIYDEVVDADVSRPRLREATRGAILARGDEGIPLLVELFNSPDEDMFQIGLSTAREFPGAKVDPALVAEMKRAVPIRAALILTAMADRPETVDLPAILEAAVAGPEVVRLAAIGALGRIGNVTCLSPLLDIANEDDEQLQQAARKSLAALPGEGINDEIVNRIDNAEGNSYLVLVELIGERRIPALPALLKASDDSEAKVRHAALVALGHTIPEDKLSVLIAPVVRPKDKGDAEIAQQALKTASVRMPDRDACAAELTAAMKKAPTVTKVALLEIIGAVGGKTALETLAASAKAENPALQDMSSKLLGEWMTIDAAPVLLDLATTAPGEKYQVRAQRGYIRIARQFVMDEPERIEMCRHAFDIAKNPAEQKLVLEVLKRYPNLETLKLALKARSEFEGLTEESMETAIAIAQKLGNQAEAVTEILAEAELPKIELKILKAEYGSDAGKKDVTEILQKHAGESQFVTLPSASYNDVFGGDPAPGAPKQLKISYKIDGKPGEAVLAENSLIILALPK